MRSADAHLVGARRASPDGRARSARGQKRGPGRSASTSKARACSAVEKVLSSFGRLAAAQALQLLLPPQLFHVALTGADLAGYTLAGLAKNICGLCDKSTLLICAAL